MLSDCSASTSGREHLWWVCSARSPGETEINTSSRKWISVRVIKAWERPSCSACRMHFTRKIQETVRQELPGQQVPPVLPDKQEQPALRGIQDLAVLREQPERQVLLAQQELRATPVRMAHRALQDLPVLPVLQAIPTAGCFQGIQE